MNGVFLNVSNEIHTISMTDRISTTRFMNICRCLPDFLSDFSGAETSGCIAEVEGMMDEFLLI